MKNDDGPRTAAAMIERVMGPPPRGALRRD
jgi:hypothetical protein